MVTSQPTTRDGARRLVVPALPLALLHAVRDSDRPGEVLEDEDLSVSLPRRLGLTGVIDSQIRRYENARQWQRTVPFDDLLSLMRLVLRRPDAASILLDAGHRVARMRHARSPKPALLALRVLPRGPLFASLRRVTRRLFRALTGDDALDVLPAPLIVRLRDPRLAQLDEIGTACRLYSGVLEEMIRLYGRKSLPIEHERCRALGHEYCEWRVAD